MKRKQQEKLTGCCFVSCILFVLGLFSAGPHALASGGRDGAISEILNEGLSGTAHETKPQTKGVGLVPLDSKILPLSEGGAKLRELVSILMDISACMREGWMKQIAKKLATRYQEDEIARELKRWDTDFLDADADADGAFVISESSDSDKEEVDQAKLDRVLYQKVIGAAHEAVQDDLYALLQRLESVPCVGLEKCLSVEVQEVLKERLPFIARGIRRFLDTEALQLDDEMCPTLMSTHWAIVDEYFRQNYFSTENEAEGLGPAFGREWAERLFDTRMLAMLGSSRLECLQTEPWLVSWEKLTQAYLYDLILNVYFSAYKVYLHQLREPIPKLHIKIAQNHTLYKALKQTYEEILRVHREGVQSIDCFPELECEMAFLLDACCFQSEAYEEELKELRVMTDGENHIFENHWLNYLAVCYSHTESFKCLSGMRFGSFSLAARGHPLMPWLVIAEVIAETADQLSYRLNQSVFALTRNMEPEAEPSAASFSADSLGAIPLAVVTNRTLTAPVIPPQTQSNPIDQWLNGIITQGDVQPSVQANWGGRTSTY